MTLEQLQEGDRRHRHWTWPRPCWTDGIHPPTMYFPLIVPEDLMVEPTETESKTTLDEVVRIMKKIHAMALEDPAHMHELPVNTVIRRPDEVKAAREPVIRYSFDK